MSKIRIGVVGTGIFSYNHINAYRKNPNCEIVAICDKIVDRAISMANELGIPNYYEDYNELIDSGKVDAISIVTPNITHHSIAVKALNSGINVLCEKPPAMSAAQAMEMAEAAKANNKVLMYGFIRRFGENARVLKNFIDNGELGNIYYAKTGVLRRCGFPGGWFGKKDLSGGGPLIDLGIHVLDLCLYMMGSKPVSVFANTSNVMGNRFNIKKKSDRVINPNDSYDVEDFANVLVKFDNGASLFLETSWTMHIKSDEVYVRFFGDKGGATLEPSLEIFSENLDVMTDIKPAIDYPSFDFADAISSEINHYVDCILGRAKCICNHEAGVTIMKLIDAIYESAESGKLVTV